MSDERFGPMGPSLDVVYGESGHGKTADVGRAFPRSVFLGPPGAFKPISTTWGFKPEPLVTVRTLYDVINLVVQIKNDPASAEKFDGIVIDDVSVLGDNTLAQLENQFSNKQQMWGELMKTIKSLREIVRYGTPMHIGVTAHVQDAYVDDVSRRERPGGPKCGSRNTTSAWAYVADKCLRTESDKSRKPFPVVYHCEPGSDRWLLKDRDSVAPRRGPVNLGEQHRAAGTTIRRLPGLEWQDEWAHRVDQEIGDDLKKRLPVMGAAFKMLLDQGVSIPHARWAVEDGADRAELRILRVQDALAAFGQGSVKQGLSLL